MSGTVDYVKVVDLLVDTIKELNVPCADTEEPATGIDSREDDRRADAVSLLRSMLNELESGAGAAGANGAAAAAEHSAASQSNKRYVNKEGHKYDVWLPGTGWWVGHTFRVSKRCTTRGWHDSSDCGYGSTPKQTGYYYANLPYASASEDTYD